MTGLSSHGIWLSQSDSNYRRPAPALWSIFSFMDASYGHIPETTHCLLSCPHPGMHQVSLDKGKLFEQWLTSVETMPNVVYCFSHCFQMAQPSLFTPFASPSSVHAAALPMMATLAGIIFSWTDCYSLVPFATDLSWLPVLFCTTCTWSTGVVLHLLALSHDLWHYCNQIIYDPMLLGLPHALELQLTAGITAQLALGHQGLPATERHYIDLHSGNPFLWSPFWNGNADSPKFPLPARENSSNNKQE